MWPLLGSRLAAGHEGSASGRPRATRTKVGLTRLGARANGIRLTRTSARLSCTRGPQGPCHSTQLDRAQGTDSPATAHRGHRHS
eukprot:6795275-Prymnesium_polylepis.1